MNDILSIIENTKIVPVVVIEDLENTKDLIQALKEGGIKIAEVTFRTSCAADAIKIINDEFDDVLVGAGTILNVEMAKQAIKAGAKFIVSPGFNQELVEYCIKEKIVIIPGCVTPSEIMAAINCGLEVIKFFPASNYGGINTIKALCGPFPNIKIMPTGGINKDNVNDYLNIKQVVACGGSWMVANELVRNKDFKEIIELTKQSLESVKS